MCGDDDRVLRVPVDGPDDVPHPVRPQVVDFRFEFPADDVSNAVLVAGDAARLRQFYEEVVVEIEVRCVHTWIRGGSGISGGGDEGDRRERSDGERSKLVRHRFVNEALRGK